MLNVFIVSLQYVDVVQVIRIEMNPYPTNVENRVCS